MTHSQHQMQITSLYQYFPPFDQDEVNQVFRQKTKAEIIKLLQDNKDLTDREMAAKLNFNDPNKVRPRRNELTKMGIVEEHTKRTCSIGNKLSIAWSLSKEKLYAFMRQA